ncbi:hypothetical protein [Piscinibacter sp.]|jgi:hypothetical protein|uniref:hypothetical protein n=1 Tax=Piscinibacter sp. TaxID=1903157 RepID=UPI002F4229C1
MKAGRIQLSHVASALLTLLAALGCGSALAADKTSPADALARYQQERAVCTSGQSNQDRATCLREAGAAFAESQRDGLNDGAAPYVRNAGQRCERLPDEDRRACVARMQGQGTTSGSAAAGGIYRELVLPTTEVPDRDPQAAPAK